jgi:hypothetical protein
MIIRYFSAIMMLICVAFIGCSSSSSDEPISPTSVTFTVSEQAITVDAQAQSTTLTVKADGDWSISSDQEWCTVFPTGGVKNEETKVTIKVTALTTKDQRVATLSLRSGSSSKSVTVTQTPTEVVDLSAKSLSAGAQAQSLTLTVDANCSWSAKSNQNWCTLSPASGNSGATDVKISVTENTGGSSREAELTFSYGSKTSTVKVTQLSDEIVTPQGYTLVWSDEFNDPSLSMPDESKWWYETAAPGWVNNELQRYVAGKQGNNVTAEVSNGILKIHAIKVGSEVISARVNTIEAWKYGYFEARLKLPKGKGTWPAFWMMPKASSNWPDCGEIDIMEEVGYNPNYTSSSIHCKAYYHSIGTQKTHEQYTAGAEDEFHTYALEWTENEIIAYIDGKKHFTFANDNKGNNDTWPFNKEFYLKLNLAWGGDWGGAQGVDESALPATYEIDYVRVFQKK